MPEFLQFYGNTGEISPYPLTVQTEWSCSLPCFYYLKPTLNPNMLSFHV